VTVEVAVAVLAPVLVIVGVAVGVASVPVDVAVGVEVGPEGVGVDVGGYVYFVGVLLHATRETTMVAKRTRSNAIFFTFCSIQELDKNTLGNFTKYSIFCINHDAERRISSCFRRVWIGRMWQ
jgi:hypothetical protein